MKGATSVLLAVKGLSIWLADSNNLQATVLELVCNLIKEINLYCIASKINVTLKGVRLSEKLQLTAALCNEILQCNYGCFQDINYRIYNKFVRITMLFPFSFYY